MTKKLAMVLTLFVAVWVMLAFNVYSLQLKLDSVEDRITDLQLRNSMLEAFMRNQRNVDQDLNDRINELILSIYPE